MYINRVDSRLKFHDITKIEDGGFSNIYAAANSSGNAVALMSVIPRHHAQQNILEMAIRVMSCSRHPHLIPCVETYAFQ